MIVITMLIATSTRPGVRRRARDAGGSGLGKDGAAAPGASLGSGAAAGRALGPLGSLGAVGAVAGGAAVPGGGSGVDDTPVRTAGQPALLTARGAALDAGAASVDGAPVVSTAG